MHAAIVTKIADNQIYITQTNGRYCDRLVTKISVCSHAQDFYVYHWPQNTGTPYTVTFDANGGTCSTANKTVYSPGKFGELPEPVPPTPDAEWLKTANKFIGWFTSKDDYGTQVTADTNVQLNSDVTLYARYGTGITSWNTYWKAPGILHFEVDNIEGYPAYRIAAFRGNESLGDAVILQKTIYPGGDIASFDLDIYGDGVPFDEQGFKIQLVPAKLDGTCLFTPQEVTGSYSWYNNLGDEATMKENFNVTYRFVISDKESEDGYKTYFYLRALQKDVDKKIGDLTIYDFDTSNGYVEAADKTFETPAKEGYEFIGWFSLPAIEDADSAMKEIIQIAAEKISHDISAFTILIDKDTYFAFVRLNVNLQDPCVLYQYDSETKELQELCQWDNVELQGLAMPDPE